MPTLSRALVDYEADLLEIIAAQWDVDLPTGDRMAAAEALASWMNRPQAVAVTWERLDEETRSALHDLLANHGSMPFSHFVRRYGELRPMGPARREREKPWLNPVSITEKLYYRGLIVRSFEQTPAGAQEHILIPEELQLLLPQPDPSLVAKSPGHAVAPPRMIRDGFNTLPDDITTLAAYLLIRQTDAREWLTLEPLPEIDRNLRRPDDPAYRALATQLLYDLELVYDEELLGHNTTRVNRDMAQPWLSAPRDHQLRSLAETWLHSVQWNDLAYTPGLAADEWPNDPRLGRHAVLNALRSVPEGIWWNLESFIAHIKEIDPDFQRPGGDYTAWYIRDAFTDEILTGFEYWEHIEGALIEFIIEGPLRWLGVVQAGHGAFVLTPLSTGLLERGTWPSREDPEARVRIDEQGLIVVPAALNRFDRLQIARFSAWVSAPPPAPYMPDRRNRDEGRYVYRLTAQSIMRAAKEGVQLSSHIVPFLQRLSHNSLPANAVQMLENWQQQPNEVIVQDVVIVSARNMGVYERLRKHRTIQKLLGPQMGPNAHAVKRQDLPALLNALRSMGILPLFEGHEKDERP